MPTPRYQCLCVCGGLSKACDCVSKPHAHSHNARAKKNAPLRFFFFFSPVVVFFFFLTFFFVDFRCCRHAVFRTRRKNRRKSVFHHGLKLSRADDGMTDGTNFHTHAAWKFGKIHSAVDRPACCVLVLCVCVLVGAYAPTMR